MPLWVAIVLAPFVGSFLNMVIYRVQEGVPFLQPWYSMCPHCKTQLRGIDLIPLCNFFILRGRCRHCQASIHWQYPLLEWLLLLGTIVRFMAGGDWLTICVDWALIAIVVTDLRYQEIPYIFSAMVGVVFLLQSGLGHVANILVVILFWLLIILVERFYYKRVVFGRGDILLYALFALRFPLPQFGLLLYSSFLIGILAVGVAFLMGRKKDDYIPFAPCIVAAYFLVSYAGLLVTTFIGSIVYGV